MTCCDGVIGLLRTAHGPGRVLSQAEVAVGLLFLPSSHST